MKRTNAFVDAARLVWLLDPRSECLSVWEIIHETLHLRGRGGR